MNNEEHNKNKTRKRLLKGMFYKNGEDFCTKKWGVRYEKKNW